MLLGYYHTESKEKNTISESIGLSLESVEKVRLLIEKGLNEKEGNLEYIKKSQIRDMIRFKDNYRIRQRLTDHRPKGVKEITVTLQKKISFYIRKLMALEYDS